MDCVYKGVCMADGACQCLQNKCNTETSKVCEDVNDCIKKKFCHTSKYCKCHQNVCLYFDEPRKSKEKCKVVEDCYKMKACSKDEACKCLQNKCFKINIDDVVRISDNRTDDDFKVKCKVVEDCYKKKACSADEACKCLKNMCEERREDNCEKDNCCQKTIKSCTKKNPCVCVQKRPTRWSDAWFKHSGICVRKADGCMPGRKLQGNKCSGSDPWGPEFEEGDECNHKPNAPRDDSCL